MTHGEYLLSNQASFAKERLEALSSLFDPQTFRRFEALGVGAGWACWEVGAGGASVTRWLADRVGARGRVLATDIDVTWASSVERDNVEVRLHDVGRDPVPGQAYDLVHARLVLVHVVEREQALAAMVKALRPGGVLVVEEADPALFPPACVEETGDAERLANALRQGFRALMTARGVDLAFGRKLPRLLRAYGLVDVAADASFPIGHRDCRTLEIATMRQIGGQLCAAGLATEEQIEEHVANVASGPLDLVTAPMISAWGTKR